MPGDRPPQIDPAMAELRAAALELTRRAYAPYSGVRVGAAGRCSDGTVVRGCNVENASYGLTQCAECSMVANMVSSGRSRLAAVSVVAADGEPLAPCGRCRQVLHEFGGSELLVDGPEGTLTLGDLLPWAFGPDDVATRAGEGSS